MLSSRPIDVDEKPAVGPRSMSQIMFKAKSALRMPCTLCTVVASAFARFGIANR